MEAETAGHLKDKMKKANVPIKDKYGKKLLPEEAQNERWVEHFKEVLKQPDPATTYDLSTAVARLENKNIWMDNVSAEKIFPAITALKTKKAPGIDKISPELLKYCHNINV